MMVAPVRYLIAERRRKLSGIGKPTFKKRITGLVCQNEMSWQLDRQRLRSRMTYTKFRHLVISAMALTSIFSGPVQSINCPQQEPELLNSSAYQSAQQDKRLGDTPSAPVDS